MPELRYREYSAEISNKRSIGSDILPAVRPKAVTRAMTLENFMFVIRKEWTSYKLKFSGY